MNDPVAQWGLVVAIISGVIGTISAITAYRSHHQVGREEPWRLTHVEKDTWLLERLHRKPATICGYDVTTLCDVVEISWMTPAAFPSKVFIRGTKEFLQVKTESAGVHLELYSKEYGPLDDVPVSNQDYQANMRGQRTDHLKKWTASLH